MVDLFTFNPTTLFGTINIGPDYKRLYDLNPLFVEIAREEDLADFEIAYKAFASNLYFSLSKKLGNLANKAIDLGFSDISCNMLDYRPGLLIIRVRALTEIV